MSKRFPGTVGCPVELSLLLLKGKWKPIILARLKERPLRYGELRRLIPEVSDKVLTERLQELHSQGLVRQDTESNGAYRLSERGETLKPLLQALYKWGERQADDLKIAVRQLG